MLALIEIASMRPSCSGSVRRCRSVSVPTSTRPDSPTNAMPTGSVGIGGQEHAVSCGECAPVAQGSGNPEVALVGDLVVAVRIGVDGEHTAGFVDGQALAGGPAQGAHDDVVSDPASVIEGG